MPIVIIDKQIKEKEVRKRRRGNGISGSIYSKFDE